jgi:NFU1 iron-sulfur cluster scaffold homolog, mitochondrial
MIAENPVIVYIESTPNPASMKFVLNGFIMKDGQVEYHNKEQAVNCPLALQLFDFSGVKSIFIANNFVTVTKTDDLEWIEIQSILREFIRGFIASGEKVFIGNPIDEVAQSEAAKVIAMNDPETVNKILEMLDEYIRPAVEGDGGAINLKSFENGVVTVQLKGSCSGCPSSTLTLKAGIENLLKRMVPGVTEVVAESI